MFGYKAMVRGYEIEMRTVMAPRILRLKCCCCLPLPVEKQLPSSKVKVVLRASNKIEAAHAYHVDQATVFSCWSIPQICGHLPYKSSLVVRYSGEKIRLGRGAQ